MLRKIAKGVTIVCGLFILVIFLAVLFGDDIAPESSEKEVATKEEASQKEEAAQESKASSGSEHWQQLDKSEEMQQKRKSLVQKLKDKGVIDHVEPASELIDVYIGPAWSRIKFDQKETFMDAVVTYYYAKDPDLRFAVIRDPYTDKKVGTFDKYGLNLN